jgi:DNA-binding NarL/FixJ family response regulator
MGAVIERDLLTACRRQIAILAGQGLSNRAIAEKLGLSEGSVKNHLHKIFRKLNLRHRIALVIDHPNSVKQLGVLTDRQGRVATLVCRGLSNREIAKILGVTGGTVKIHLHEIYQKLGVHSRTELANALAH